MNKFELNCSLYEWIKELMEHIDDKDKVIFLHLDVDVITGEMTTSIKVANRDRELQGSK